MANSLPPQCCTAVEPAPPEIAIRPLEVRREFDACVDLQRQTWGHEYSDVVPVSMLQVTAKMGGVVLGAFDAANAMLGFVYGLTGVRRGRVAHWSHMLAVCPEARNMGVGLRLKLRQKDMLLEAGVDTVYWTFDPLVSRNAHLNINRLGVRVEEYVPDMYGRSDSDLHKLGTDRFVVQWKLADARCPAAPGSPEDLASRAPRTARAAGRSDPPKPASRPIRRRRRGELEVPVPRDIAAVEARSVEDALRWRKSTRKVFTRLLSEGHEVVGFVPGPEESNYIVAPRRTLADPVQPSESGTFRGEGLLASPRP